MKIAIGSDHAGFAAKSALIEYLLKNHDILDVGPDDDSSCDYSEFAHDVANLVLRRKAECGIVVCGTGLGVSIAANKFPTVRAALCVNEEYAKLAREHNDANVLAMGARMTSIEEMKKIVDTFLTTEFEGGRHEARVAKIDIFRVKEHENGCDCECQCDDNGECECDGDCDCDDCHCEEKEDGSMGCNCHH